MLNEAEVALGTLNAKALVTMIADIEAQENGGELLLYTNDITQVGDNDALQISFGHDFHAFFTPVGKRFHRGLDGCILWSTVERLKLLAIEGCHGS